jgi:hypothetical protein
LISLAFQIGDIVSAKTSGKWASKGSGLDS